MLLLFFLTLKHVRYIESTNKNNSWKMHAQQRLQTILDILESKASLSVRDLADQLRVTAMTVRRDLHTLERKGLLRTVRGGPSARKGEATNLHCSREPGTLRMKSGGSEPQRRRWLEMETASRST